MPNSKPVEAELQLTLQDTDGQLVSRTETFKILNRMLKPQTPPMEGGDV